MQCAIAPQRCLVELAAAVCDGLLMSSPSACTDQHWEECVQTSHLQETDVLSRLSPLARPQLMLLFRQASARPYFLTLQPRLHRLGAGAVLILPVSCNNFATASLQALMFPQHYQPNEKHLCRLWSSGMWTEI